MFQHNPLRLPFLAAGLALVLIAVPVQAEDRAADPVRPIDVKQTGKETTISGKVVDLHAFMTGEKHDYRDKPATRTNPDDRAKPEDTTRKPDDKSIVKIKNEIMGLETSSGLVLLCFKDAPGIYATPRIDDPRAVPPTPPTPRTPGAPATPGTAHDTADKADKPDSGRWLDKHVQVTGTMYEKNGIKFFVVTKVMASTDTTTPGTTTTPRPGTTPDPTPKPR